MSKLIGDILVSAGAISPEQLKEALELQKTNGGYLGELLLSSGYIKEEAFAYALSLQYGQDLPYIGLDKYTLTPEIIRLAPRDFVNRYRVVPVDRFRDILTLAIADPENIDEISEKLGKLTGMKLEVFLTTTGQLNRAIARYF